MESAIAFACSFAFWTSENSTLGASLVLICVIVIVGHTSIGVAPVDNPDRIQSASTQKWSRYDISLMRLLLIGAE